MLIGQKDITIDDKGRLVLPSLFRDAFTGGKSYASLGLDGCLELYPTDIYLAKAEKIIALNDLNLTARKVQRTFLANTYEIPIDSHNRILLPKNLLEKTDTGRKVVVLGLFDHLEIWDADKYAALSKEEESTYSENASSLLEK